MVSFEEVWARLKAHEGEVFRQIKGGEFRYQIASSTLVPDSTNQNIPRGHLEEASKLVPFRNTMAVQHLRGPSYIYAVLMDARIRGSDW